jgi:methylated-DNA-[protein]-cysteine S-methyltransferase
VLDLAILDSPIGPLTLAAHDGRVCALSFGSCEADVRSALARWYPGEPVQPGGEVTGAAALRAYFGGEVSALDRVPVELNGTPFQRRVWEALREVKPGHPVSYGHLAKAIGAPSAVRAVGAANGANPVAVIVPCHRVIGSNGTLTGYGGGLERKQWLLNHEAGIPTLFARAILPTATNQF